MDGIPGRALAPGSFGSSIGSVIPKHAPVQAKEAVLGKTWIRATRLIAIVWAGAAQFLVCGVGHSQARDPPAPILTLQPPATVAQTPVISDTHNPAALDYVVQQPLFEEAPWRRALEVRGIQVIAHYVSESAANSNGVRGRGVAYAQQIDIGASFDLEKLGVWDSAVVRVAFSDRAGRSLAAERTGGDLAYQEIYGQGQNLRIDELSIEKTFAAKALALKLGFYPLGNDFGTLPYVCNFQNVGFCGHPQSLPTNSGWSDGPAGRWGARLLWRISGHVHAQVGVFDVNPKITLPSGGFKLDLSGSTGVIVPVEISYQLGKRPSDYGGVYKLGAYYDTSSASDVGQPQRSVRGRYGFYLEAAQQVFKTGPDRRNGLALFAVYTRSDKATARYIDYVEAGAAYRGLIPGRDLDLVSVGWVRADFNSRLQDELLRNGRPAPARDELMEFNYGIQVLPSLTVRPGIQYDFRPGGLPNSHGVVVGGLQVKLTL
jgi:porin